MKNLVIHVGVCILVALLLLFFHANTVASITVLALATVNLIIFGEHFVWEKRLEEKGWLGREAVIPAVALLIAFGIGAVSGEQIVSTFFDKIDIILFILAFALISYGVGKSGFFEYAAYYFTKQAKGNTTALIFFIFILASLMTYMTSNDIVVLMLTPIIFSIAVYGNITNAKQLFLSQFVAANTVSMGLILGSPTNIIIADRLEIAFFPYFLLMFVPFLVSFIISTFIVYLVIKCTSVKRGAFASLGWGYNKRYAAKQIFLRSTFTGEMKYWVFLFCFLVILTAIATQLRTTLLWVSLLGAFLGMISLLVSARVQHVSLRTTTRNALSKLPYSILAFGMCFFIFAAAVAESDFVQSTVVPLVNQLLRQDSVIVGIVGVFTSGVLVNLLNDLPASALLSEIISQTSAQGTVAHWVLIQSVLIGVNIGCYLTPIGALAGIVWFNLLRTERKRQKTLKQETESRGEMFVGNVDVLTPTRLDLVKYGIIQFVPVALITAIVNAFVLSTWWELLFR